MTLGTGNISPVLARSPPPPLPSARGGVSPAIAVRKDRKTARVTLASERERQKRKDRIGERKENDGEDIANRIGWLLVRGACASVPWIDRAVSLCSNDDDNDGTTNGATMPYQATALPTLPPPPNNSTITANSASPPAAAEEDFIDVAAMG